MVVFAVTTVTANKLDTLKATNEVARQGFTSAAERTKQLECLTRNIYWESASEPFEGKVAVAQVTINRVASGKFASDICGVVYQKNVVYDKVICNSAGTVMAPVRFVPFIQHTGKNQKK